jgi:hypothetical protein
MRGAAEAAGRDPKSVEITAGMPDDPAELSALAARGIGRVLVPVTSVAGLKTSARGVEGVLSWVRHHRQIRGPLIPRAILSRPGVA